MGCLSQCRFSNWAQHEPEYTNGKKADPRSFCIQKTLQDIAHTADDPEAVENNLMFSGHNAYRFASRPVLQQRLRAHGAATRGAHPDGPVSGVSTTRRHRRGRGYTPVFGVIVSGALPAARSDFGRPDASSVSTAPIHRAFLKVVVVRAVGVGVQQDGQAATVEREEGPRGSETTSLVKAI